MDPIYETATVYTANALTFHRGGPGDVDAVYVYHNVDPNHIPAYTDFTEVALITDGPLQEGNLVDVLAKIGPGLDQGAVQVTPGDVTLAGDTPPRLYQRWVAIRTADEFIIEAVDMVPVLGSGA